MEGLRKYSNVLFMASFIKYSIQEGCNPISKEVITELFDSNIEFKLSIHPSSISCAIYITLCFNLFRTIFWSSFGPGNIFVTTLKEEEGVQMENGINISVMCLSEYIVPDNWEKERDGPNNYVLV